MFMHIFGYRFRCLIRDKEKIFWTLLFPLLLSTLYFFAFGHLMDQQEAFEPIKVAVVDNAAYQKDIALQRTLDSVSQPGASQFLQLTITSEQEAEQLLEQGNVAGIIHAGEPIALGVKQTGMRQSILKAFLDDYAQTTKTATRILSKNPAAAQPLLNQLGQRRDYTKQVSFSAAKPDPMLNYFYSLIAMTCLYGSFWGLQNSTDIQADLSAQGARRSVAPTHKLKVVLYDAAAAVLILLAEVLLLLAYLIFVLRIDFGGQGGYILLTCLAGCITGVAYGTCIGTLVRKSEGVKTAILVASSLLMCFLAGFMHYEMKYAVDRHVPLLSYINPAALITDAFYCLYIFENHTRFFLNLGLLFLLAAILCIISFLQLRREKYASV